MPREPKRFWPWCRRLFRWCRLLVWFSILAVLGCLLYLNRIGVPRFIQEQVETELRTRGLDAHLGRVRVLGFYELAAQDIQFGRMGQTNGPTFRLREAELRLDPEALRQFEIRIHSIGFRSGQLLWPLLVTNDLPQALSVDDISAELDLSDRNLWKLDYLSARFLGAELVLSAAITNGAAWRAWKTGEEPPPPPRAAEDWASRVNEWTMRLKSVQLPPSSVLTVNVRGDGRDPASFQMDLKAKASFVKIPLGQVRSLNLTANLTPSLTERGAMDARLNAHVSSLESTDKLWRLRDSTLQTQTLFVLTNLALRSARMGWSAAHAETRWAQASDLRVSADTEPSGKAAGDELRTRLSVAARTVESAQARGLTNQLTAEVSHSLTNVTALDGQWQMTVQQLLTKWGETEAVRFAGRVASTNFLASGPGDRSWGAGSLIDALELDWDCQLGPVKSSEIQLDSLHSIGQWRAPNVSVTRLRSSLHGGQADASALLNVASRELTAQGTFDFDVHRLENLLTPMSRRWLRQFTWEKPPVVTATASLILPAWTNAQPNWREEVQPTLQLAGHLAGGAGTYRGASVSGASSHFTFTDQVWRLPDLLVHRPEGDVKLAHVWDMRTKDYYWDIDSRIDLRALKPLLNEPELRVLGMFEFSAPPEIRGEVWGRWEELERIGFKARVAATNFSFRAEHCDDFSSEVIFTNLLFQFRDVLVRRGEERITASSVAYDAKEKLVFLANAVSRMEPGVVTRVLGPMIHEQMQPYRFQKPPLVRAHGVLPTTPDYSRVDAHFEVTGEDFSYWKFNTPRISGRLHWRGDALSITNVEASFYGGTLAWSGEFDFTERTRTDFGFRAHVQEAELRLLMADLSPATNQLEGALNGDLVITSAQSDDPKSWKGYGNARLRDGFLWSIPVFGFLSPVLDSMIPKLGQNPVTEASATFKIDQSVIHTRDLEVRASALRLQYDGSVDLEGNVNATVRAEPLRDAWAVGRVLNLALWPVTKLFEFKVTGTLARPEREPLYFPKFLLFPLNPLKTIREFFSEEGKQPK